MPTVGGVLMRMVGLNIRGTFGGEPWNWPPATNCQLLYEALAVRKVAEEEINFPATGGASGGGSINSVGEFVAAIGVENASTLVDQALAKGEELANIERTLTFQATAQSRVGGVGRVERTTFAPLTRLAQFSGQDLAIMEESYRNLPAPVAEALLRRLNEADRDGQLGIINPSTFLIGGV